MYQAKIRHMTFPVNRAIDPSILRLFTHSQFLDCMHRAKMKRQELDQKSNEGRNFTGFCMTHNEYKFSLLPMSLQAYIATSRKTCRWSGRCSDFVLFPSPSGCVPVPDVSLTPPPCSQIHDGLLHGHSGIRTVRI